MMVRDSGLLFGPPCICVNTVYMTNDAWVF